jgi:SagB-type dehydrogenase family enzyme
MRSRAGRGTLWAIATRLEEDHMADARRHRSTPTRTESAIERIEGPAPFEDSSVPADPADHAAAIHAAASVALPAPNARGAVSLEEALARRRSTRSFTHTPLTAQELSQLLWAAQGITARPAARTSPSAGAIHPLELYVATGDGCHHYRPDGHRLEPVTARDLRPSLAAAAHDETALREAAAVVVITAVLSRTTARYGERAWRYVMLEAGHVAENLLLQAAALGLGAVPIGAFDGERMGETLGAAADRTPLYLVAIGRPALRDDRRGADEASRRASTGV